MAELLTNTKTPGKAVALAELASELKTGETTAVLKAALGAPYTTAGETFHLTIDEEIVLAEVVSGKPTELKLTRKQEKSTEANHTPGTAVWNYLTAAALERWRQGVGNVLTYEADPKGEKDSTEAFKKAGEASGVIYAEAGTYLIAGELELKGKRLIGDGMGVTILKKANAAAGMLKITEGKGEIRDLTIENTVTPTSGTSIKLSGSAVAGTPPSIIDSVEILKPWIGIEMVAGPAAQMYGAQCNNIFIKNSQKLAFYLHEGPVLQTLTNFVFEQLEEGSPETTAMLLEGNVQALVCENGEVIGHSKGLVATSATLGQGSGPYGCRFVDVFFDTQGGPHGNVAGGVLSHTASFTFTGGWFAGGTNKYGGFVEGGEHHPSGLKLETCNDITFYGTEFIENDVHGCVLSGECRRIAFNGSTFKSNSRNIESKADGLHVEGGPGEPTTFKVIGGAAASPAGAQEYGIHVLKENAAKEASVIDGYIILGVNTGENLKAGVLDEGTGTNKVVGPNFDGVGSLAVTGGFPEKAIGAEAVTGTKLKPGVPEASKELKAGVKVKGIASNSTIVYLSAIFKAEETEGEILADGKKIYAIQKQTFAAGDQLQRFMFKMKAGAEFELKLVAGKGALEGATSTYVLQAG